jgi:uncharacterized protein with NAD-binding domain and iron-sulfur cluster
MTNIVMNRAAWSKSITTTPISFTLDDEEVLPLVQENLAGCLPEFGEAQIVDHSVIRIPQGVTHFAPGSYQYLLPGQTSFQNVFMSGDWIVTRHGSWSQEKAYVTGLEAANRAAHSGAAIG